MCLAALGSWSGPESRGCDIEMAVPPFPPRWRAGFNRNSGNGGVPFVLIKRLNATRTHGRYSRRSRKGILEIIRVLAVGDLDGHFAHQSYQLTRAGVRHHADHQLRRSAGHGAAVLQDEAATAALQCSRNFLHRDVTCRTLHAGRSRQHLSLAGSLKIAMELLVERHSSDIGI